MNTWYNCTDGCHDYTITENGYTGSVYTTYCDSSALEELSDLRLVQEHVTVDDVDRMCDSEYTKGTKNRVDSVKLFWPLMSCLIITVLVCVPICSFMCMTKKRVYKKSADGLGIDFSEDDSQLMFEKPVVEEFKQGEGVTPPNGALVEKDEINT